MTIEVNKEELHIIKMALLKYKLSEMDKLKSYGSTLLDIDEESEEYEELEKRYERVFGRMQVTECLRKSLKKI